MFVAALIMSLTWQTISPNYRAPRAPVYLSPTEQVRWEILRQRRLLYEGKHDIFYLHEARTHWKFPGLIAEGGRIVRPYVTYNLLGLMSVKTADLLFGGKAKIEAPTTQQTDKLDELARRSLLHPRLHGAMVQASWAGGAFLESTRWRNQVYIENVPPEEMFPQGRLMPDGQYDRYVRYSTDVVPGKTPNTFTSLLLETSYEPGAIRRQLYQLGDDGTRTKEVPLEMWPAFADNVPAPEISTGIVGNTITYVANILGDRLEVSDYEPLISLQDTVNAKYAQVALILQKHSNPKLRAPRAASKTNGNLSASAEVVYADGKDDWGYITWDGQIAPAITDRAEAVDATCVAGEMSPAILGIKRDAVPESAAKLRLAATNTLAKVNRKSLVAEPSIARAVETTQQLERSSPVSVSFAVDPVGVHMRDGLPDDPEALATEASTWRSANLMSIEDGVAMRIEDPDAAAVEVQRIKSEMAQSLPSSLLGEPPAAPSEDAGAESDVQDNVPAGSRQGASDAG